jgi:hypothetical protein
MTPAEIQAAIQAFQLLEPQAQKGIAALIHLIHHTKNAQDYIAEAQALLDKLPPPPVVPTQGA